MDSARAREVIKHWTPGDGDTFSRRDFEVALEKAHQAITELLKTGELGEITHENGSRAQLFIKLMIQCPSIVTHDEEEEARRLAFIALKDCQVPGIS